MQVELDRRRPGQSRVTSPRKETGTCKILSGITEGMTTGTPIHVFVPNTGQRGSTVELKVEMVGIHEKRLRKCLSKIKGCPVNFEFMNYTIIASQCKGPQYPAKLCCDAFKEFACPYVDELNDVSNGCASTMFSYINIYGTYPPGLFSSECQEDKKGLKCSIAPAQSANDNANGGQLAQKLSRLLILGVGFLLFQFL